MTRSKYRNRRTQVAGIWFDSQKEARRYQDLLLLERAGKIESLHVHPRYYLTRSFLHDGAVERAIIYEADFAYLDRELGRMVVEDVKSKGTRTQAYRIKRKLFLIAYPEFEFREVDE